MASTASAGGGGASSGGGASVVAKVSVGSRVVSKDGARGTVRYIGPVATSKKAENIYAGIEWDDPSRGKHDGSVTAADGTVTRHFSCPAGAGSFIKIDLVDAGVSFLAALADRYEDHESGGGGFFETDSGTALPVTLVGDTKIRERQRLGKLWNVSLQDSRVSSVEHGLVAELSPNIQELDLRDNLFATLEPVGILGSQLPKLQTLNLGGNRFSPLTPAVASSFSGCFSALQVLVLSGTGMSWPEVQLLEPAFPLLSELHLTRNKLRTLKAGRDGELSSDSAPSATTARASGFEQLTLLNLADNDLSDWSEIEGFSALPKLQRLYLANNAFTTLSTEAHAVAAAGGGGDDSGGGSASGASSSSSAVAGPFPSLQAVSLSDNAIADWPSLEAIAKYPSVTSLRFQSNPLVASMGPSQARQVLIARLAQLGVLNGSVVRDREREDAEKHYMRIARSEFLASVEGADPSKPDDVLFGNGTTELGAAMKTAHPRYFELVAKHGAVAAPSASDSSTATLGSTVVKVSLRSMAAGSSDMDAVTKRLPLTMTVTQLKQLCSRLFRTDATLLRLSVRDSTDAYPALMDDDLKTLSYYAVSDGSEVLLEEIDPREAARQAEDAARAQATKMAEQEAAGNAVRAAQEASLRQQTAGASASVAAKK